MSTHRKTAEERAREIALYLDEGDYLPGWLFNDAINHITAALIEERNRAGEALFIVANLERSIAEFSGSGEFVRLDVRQWAKLKRQYCTLKQEKP
jgi:hypothetical protein